MATSQNGWTVFTSGTHASLVASPWITGRIRGGSVAVVFNYLGRRFNADVEPIRRDWSWGYAYRAIRGATSGYSNHASGTAVDFNAPRHPLGKRGTFTAAQVRAIRSILADLGGVVRWGGDWSRPDEMHFEIAATAAAVTRVAQRLTAAPVTNPITTTPTPPSSPAPVTPEDDDMPLNSADQQWLRDMVKAEVHQALNTNPRVTVIHDRVKNYLDTKVHEVRDRLLDELPGRVWSFKRGADGKVRGADRIDVVQQLADILTKVTGKAPDRIKHPAQRTTPTDF